MSRHRQQIRPRLLPVLGIIALVAALLGVGRLALVNNVVSAAPDVEDPVVPVGAPVTETSASVVPDIRRVHPRAPRTTRAIEPSHPVERAEGEASDKRPQQARRTEAQRVSTGLRARVQDAADELTVDPATFRLASFNVLGYSHTKRGGNKCCRWAGGTTRMSWAVQLIRANGINVVGFQEFEKQQHSAFMSTTGGSWAAYPGLQLGNNAVRNSIAWNTSVFELVEAHTVPIPYFHGKPVPMPYVELRHKETGRLAWFINVHNPASVRGPAQHWRDVATAREVALMNDLQASGVPTFLTGDFNEKGEAFCRVTAGANAQAANGGTSSPCQLPGNHGIDWIFGSTPGVAFSGYVRLSGGQVARASDHPMVFSDVTLSGDAPRAG